MAKKFRDLYKAMPEDRRARVEARVAELKAEMPLAELRRARQLTQGTLAATLGESQPSVSQLERQTDMYVSTLRSYIEAMGGELEILAHFPDGDVRISQFRAVA